MNLKAIIDGNTLKTVITAFAAKLKTATLDYNEDGIVISAMDPDGLILAKYECPSHSFREFEVKTEGSLVFDLCEFGHAIKRATAGNYATLTHDTRRGRLGLTFQGSLGSWKTFEFPVTEPKSPPQKLDDEGFTAILSLNPEILLEIVKDLKWMADTLILSATLTKGEPGFSVFAGKNDGITSQVELTSRTWYSLEVVTPTRCQYPLKYIAPFAKLASCAQGLQMEFSNRDFLKLEYRIIDAAAQGIRDIGTVTCMLAAQGETGFVSFVPDPGQADLLRFCEEAHPPTPEGEAPALAGDEPEAGDEPIPAGDEESEDPIDATSQPEDVERGQVFAEYADVLGVSASASLEVPVDDPAGDEPEDEE